jgi:hypothetical protein
MYPDFLGIGAQKSGTTWLHANLRPHPQIWMPPIKELHYLDRGRAPLVERLFGNVRGMRKARSHLMNQLRGLPKGGRLSDLTWALRYYLASGTDAWYRSLFPEIPGKIAGEICVGYARLRGEAVARVHRLMPDAKVIYLLRNPVERSWSYAAQFYTKRAAKDQYGGLDKVPQAELWKFFKEDEDVTGHSDYLGALAAWECHYGRGQMHVAFFDELAANPTALLRRILDFLEVDSSDGVIPATVGTTRNAGRGSAMPPEIRAFLSGLHYDQIAKLHARFDNCWTEAWLSSAEEAIAAERLSTSASADRVR